MRQAIEDDIVRIRDMARRSVMEAATSDSSASADAMPNV